MIEHDDGIWLRQSWIDTFFICPERARYTLIYPDEKTTSDTAAVGTCLHMAAELVLLGETVEDAADVAAGHFHDLAAEPGYRATTYSAEEAEDQIRKCLTAWVRDIKPHVPAGGVTEWNFRAELGTLDDGRTFGFQGTADYIHTGSNTVWDWKTTKTKARFTQAAKQQSSPQASIYCYAANLHGFVELPTTFTYGVVVRGDRPFGQLVTITRDERDIEWTIRQATQLLNMWLRCGVDIEWPANDSHYLCSPTWCQWWHRCRGAHAD